MSGGQKLYEVWRTEMNNQGCETDEWQDIGDMEQVAWQAVYDAVQTAA